MRYITVLLIEFRIQFMCYTCTTAMFAGFCRIFSVFGTITLSVLHKWSSRQYVIINYILMIHCYAESYRGVVQSLSLLRDIQVLPPYWITWAGPLLRTNKDINHNLIDVNSTNILMPTFSIARGNLTKFNQLRYCSNVTSHHSPSCEWLKNC